MWRKTRNRGLLITGICLSVLLGTHALTAYQRRVNLETSRSNLQQIGQALLLYHDDYGKYPDTCNRNNAGKAMLSWRVHLLPYLGHQELYDRFKLDEPWDSDHNRQLISQMPVVYQNPDLSSEEFKTNYLLPVGKKSIFEEGIGVNQEQVIDGLAHTIILLESNSEWSIPWTRPFDLQFEYFQPGNGLGDARKLKDGTIGFLCLMADGTVNVISNNIRVTVMANLISFAGQESFSFCGDGRFSGNVDRKTLGNSNAAHLDLHYDPDAPVEPEVNDGSEVEEGVGC